MARKKKFSDMSQYRRYRSMLNRCYCTTNTSFPRYGGRGITVCDRWRASYENYLQDMGLPPTDKHSLGRSDNDAGYSPENCRWETNSQQTRNFSRNRILEWHGERKCLAQWAEDLGLTYQALAYRLNGLHWSVEVALSTPPLGRTKRFISLPSGERVLVDKRDQNSAITAAALKESA